MDVAPPPEGPLRGFWSINIGHILTLITMLMCGLVAYTTFVREFSGLESRVILLEKDDSTNTQLPLRVTILETKLDVLQAQLTQLNQTSMRTVDLVSTVREDVAAIKVRVQSGN